GAKRVQLRFTSRVLLHRFAFDLSGIDYQASDNFFELYPNEPKTIVVDFAQPVRPAQVREALTYRSLVDTYA
ncbi:MAG TPA: glycoside hydrolase family 2 protein, partial [Candidatus Synoicihabitans sp.]|nr:glycoside hydrolase family 2 protein [Candidatus Synoicihabitans sp.]